MDTRELRATSDTLSLSAMRVRGLQLILSAMSEQSFEVENESLFVLSEELGAIYDELEHEKERIETIRETG